MRNYLAKVSLLLFVGAILLLQMHTLMTSRNHGTGVDVEGAHIGLNHHGDDDDEGVPHYVMEIGNIRARATSVKEEDTWIVLNETQRTKLNQSLKNTHHLTMTSQGRLGNNMFAYASLLGIAKDNRMIPLIHKDSLLPKYFYISAKVTNTEKPERRWPRYSDNKVAYFDNRALMLNYSMDIELSGYFQSWKYFWSIKDQLVREFMFHPDIQSFAEGYVQNIVFESLGYETLLLDLIYVGIHIRRGDMLEPHNVEKGYTVAPREYIMAAIKYFEDKYDPQKLVFMVCSDDMIWVKTNMRRQRAPMVYSLFHKPIEDLAILSRCHHVITTVGSFSWWAGFLSGGTVLYYEDFPRPGSSIAKSFSPEDYFPSEWIGIGNKDIFTSYEIVFYVFIMFLSNLVPILLIHLKHT